MTFEQFLGTRVWTDDLGAMIPDAAVPDAGPGRGWVYLGSLYIEEVGQDWPDSARADGRWYLRIGRDEYITNDLTRLERILFDYAVAEGFEVEG